jgi:hypothetical protein
MRAGREVNEGTDSLISISENLKPIQALPPPMKVILNET